MDIFVSPVGQTDNLGDSVLRRPLLEQLRPYGTLHVFAGPDRGYRSGLGLAPQDVVHARGREWLAAGLRSAAARPTGFAVNAGELLVLRTAVLAGHTALAGLVRARGGAVVAAGMGLRAGTDASARVLRPLLLLADPVVWRDGRSAAVAGLGGTAPDWAFATGRSAEELAAQDAPRTLVAVSLRGDRPPPSPTWCAAVQELARRSGCELLVVTQVRRDAARAAELGTRLGARVLPWGAASHAEHEQVVRAAYAASAAVVSDRIHVLILGLTEGAVPVGCTTGDPEKVARTFAGVTDVPLAFAQDELAGGPEGADRMQAVVADRERLLVDLAAARRRLDEVGREIGRVLSARSHP